MSWLQSQQSNFVFTVQILLEGTVYIYIYMCVCVYVCVCASVCPTTLHHLMRLYDWCAIIKAQQVEYHPWAKHLENNII